MCSMHETDHKCIQTFSRKNLNGERQFVRRRPRWEENIKVDFLEVEWKIVD
jgi:hypothetical protein